MYDDVVVAEAPDELEEVAEVVVAVVVGAALDVEVLEAELEEVSTLALPPLPSWAAIGNANLNSSNT